MLYSIYTTVMSRNEEIPVYNRIAQQRELLGMSRQQLAELVSVHYQTIGYLERGEYSPSLVLALKISEVLGQDVQSLFSIKPIELNSGRSIHCEKPCIDLSSHGRGSTADSYRP